MKSKITAVLFSLSLLIFFIGNAQSSTQKISGYITSFEEPLQNVNIGVKGSNVATISNAKGRYEIMAAAKDIIVFSFTGLETQEIVVEDITNILNIEMFPKVEALDEVIVTDKRIYSQADLAQEYSFNRDIINTAYGFINTRYYGGKARILDEEDIKFTGLDFAELIETRTNAQVLRSPFDLSVQIFLRVTGGFGGARPVIYDIDGLITEIAPINLPVSDIKRIAIIYGLDVRNGSRGGDNFGTIVINTKSARYKKLEDSGKPFDYARVRDNVYTENLELTPTNVAVPIYLAELKNASSLRKAKAIFESQETIYGDLPYYKLEVARLLKTRWGAVEMSEDIRASVREDHKNNAAVLKALAYSYEQEGNTKTATSIYEQVFKLRPSYGQSYRDLANIYRETGSFDRALKLYARYENYRKEGKEEGKLQGIDSIIRTEATNLVATQPEAFKSYQQLELNEDIWPVRLVFEWSDGEAEFDVQMVNPDNHYYVWSHSLEKNRARIADEKTKGYSSEQFYVDEMDANGWRINIDYKGNKAYHPTYLKVTAYYNYGTVLQEKEIQVFRLQEKKKRNLFTLQNSRMVLNTTLE